MPTVQLNISANPHQQEELIALLSDFTPLGFEETPEELLAYFQQENFDITAIGGILDGYDHVTTLLEDRNWNEVWEKNFSPVVVDGFVTVRAEFHSPAKDTPHEIIITPKMSFGTGHHATTWLMMDMMREMDFRGKSVLDFGTGTGILAILAAKLGAEKIIAIDSDEWSIENARENCSRNGFSIQTELSSRIPDQKFDIILANINRNVILQYLKELKQACESPALLLVSGFLNTDSEVIAASALENGFLEADRKQKQDWCCILLRSL